MKITCGVLDVDTLLGYTANYTDQNYRNIGGSNSANEKILRDS